MSDLTDSPGGSPERKPESKNSIVPFVDGKKIAYVVAFVLGVFILRSVLSYFLSYQSINFLLGIVGLVVIASLLVTLLQPDGDDEVSFESKNNRDIQQPEWPVLMQVGQHVDASMIHAKLISEGIPTVIETQTVSGYGLLDPLKQKIRVHPDHLNQARTLLSDSPYKGELS